MKGAISAAMLLPTLLVAQQQGPPPNDGNNMMNGQGPPPNMMNGQSPPPGCNGEGPPPNGGQGLPPPNGGQGQGPPPPNGNGSGQGPPPQGGNGGQGPPPQGGNGGQGGGMRPPPNCGQGGGGGPPGGGGGGGRPGGGGDRRGNLHSEFGYVEDCQPPACDIFTISQQVIEEAFSDFLFNEQEKTTFSYCGAWWSANVGPRVQLEEGFCETGAGANQECQEVEYDGVTLDFGGSNDNQYTIESFNQPLHQAENYCSVEVTPPLLECDFETKYTYPRTLAPSNRHRGDISAMVGVAVNGVSLFHPYTGKQSVAIHDESLDSNFGHPARGRYHYHGYTTAILNERMEDVLALTRHSRIVGIAHDGFPIYGPVGYSEATDAASSLKLVTSGYGCTGEAGAACNTQEMRDPYNWKYQDGLGDLDECNGRYGATPEFPEGMYYYVMTVDDTGYPTFPGLPYCHQSETGEGTNSDSSYGATTSAESTEVREEASSSASKTWIGWISTTVTVAAILFV